MSNKAMSLVDESNKEQVIKLLNMNLVKQDGFYNDFLITDITATHNGIHVETKDASEEQKSDRKELINKVLKACGIEHDVI
jgi:pimeloyl-CoA synthetase